MGDLREADPVKLIVGILGNKRELFEKAEIIFNEKFGNIDFKSDYISFNFTDYYEKEMGNGLLKRFYSFSNLIDPSIINKIKLFSIDIEDEFSSNGKGKKRRQINIDPGYVAMSKLVLASTKDRSHRIYLGDRIFAEVTLLFENKEFIPMKWTYADYRTKEYRDILLKIRQIYAMQLKNSRLL